MRRQGYKIVDWEKAIKCRADIEFREIYLEDDLVRAVIGTISKPAKRKVNGELRKKRHLVRWNRFGVCMNPNGTANDNLCGFNIKLERDYD